MMKPELALKLAQNQQRRERERILAQLPERWQELLKTADFFCRGDFFTEWPFEWGRQYVRSTYLDDKRYSYHDVDDMAHAQDWLRASNQALQPPILLCLDIGPCFILEQPVPLAWLSELLTKDNHHCYAMEQGFARGAFVDTYLGYLEPARMTNNRELIFELLFFEPKD